MALALPVPSWFAFETNLSGGPSTAPGTLITANSTIHTKGSWTNCIDLVDVDSFGLWVGISESAASNTRTDQLLDIGIGPFGGGSEQVIVSNLIAGWSGAGSGGTTYAGRRFFLPIFIPKGVRVSARSQALISSDTVRLQLGLLGGMSNLGWPVCVGVDDYGIDTATSGGTSHTAGNSGAFSAYTNFGSTLSRHYKGVLTLPQGTMSDTVMTSQAYYWEAAVPTADTLASWQYETTTAENVTGPWPGQPFMCELPSGTQMQVRASASGTAEAMDVGMYLLY